MSDDKVISIFDKEKKKTKRPTEEVDWDEIIKQNMEKKEKVKEERAKKNKKITKQNRLKKD
ncbi:MAG TPA: hypothetical protein DF712_19445 [Balneola sp.]|nr:hypothetical protein [Balneola sp.]|tara:strand:- start:408 stop:590 length:183 start_codon:yes stop_codon:yes gene_type:complete